MPGRKVAASRSWTSARRAPCSGPAARRLGRRPHMGPRAAHDHARGWAPARGTPHREPLVPGFRPSSAICSRTSRISSRSTGSSSSLRASSRSADRVRRRAAASRSAVRTASESFSPSERTTSSAAAVASSRRTCSERATGRGVARSVLHASCAAIWWLSDDERDDCVEGPSRACVVSRRLVPPRMAG